jgi:hypothetical protein
VWLARLLLLPLLLLGLLALLTLGLPLLLPLLLCRSGMLRSWRRSLHTNNRCWLLIKSAWLGHQLPARLSPLPGSCLPLLQLGEELQLQLSHQRIIAVIQTAVGTATSATAAALCVARWRQQPAHGWALLGRALPSRNPSCRSLLRCCRPLLQHSLLVGLTAGWWHQQLAARRLGMQRWC